jgi:hypothetical protein
MIMAFSQQTLPPFDGCLYTLKSSISGLPQSSLPRCLQRPGISRLPDSE